MALTSASTRADALAQFRDNLNYLASPSAAALFHEAVVYLMQDDPVSLSVGGRNYSRESLSEMRREAFEIAQSATDRKMRIARGRVTNAGRLS